MSNAPVYYALAQAHFNPVAAMSKYVDQIQDRLRREGYPLFEPQQVTHLVVPGPGQAQQAEPQITQVLQWLITRSDRTFIPVSGTEFQDGDILYLAVIPSAMNRLEEMLGIERR